MLLPIAVLSFMYGTLLLHEAAIYSKVRDTAMNPKSVARKVNLLEVARYEKGATAV